MGLFNQTAVTKRGVDDDNASASLVKPVREPLALVKQGTEVPASAETVQVAARLKLLLGPDQRMIAVGSIQEADGSTLLAASLGAAFAKLEQNAILVIDANTQRPRLGGLFGIAPGGSGFLELLEGKAEIDSVTLPSLPANLFFLALGRSQLSLASLLGTPHCIQVMAQLRRRYRYIIVDCGTVFESPEEMLLASLCDAMIGVVAAQARTRNQIAAFKQSLDSLKIPFLGAVLTTGAAAK